MIDEQSSVSGYDYASDRSAIGAGIYNQNGNYHSLMDFKTYIEIHQPTCLLLIVDTPLNKISLETKQSD